MFGQVPADAGQGGDDRQAVAAQLVLRADPRQQQQAGGGDGAGGEDDLAFGSHGAALPAGDVLDRHRPAAGHDDALYGGARPDGEPVTRGEAAQVAGGGVAAPAAALVDLD